MVAQLGLGETCQRAALLREIDVRRYGRDHTAVLCGKAARNDPVQTHREEIPLADRLAARQAAVAGCRPPCVACIAAGRQERLKRIDFYNIVGKLCRMIRQMTDIVFVSSVECVGIQVAAQNDRQRFRGLLYG